MDTKSTLQFEISEINMLQDLEAGAMKCDAFIRHRSISHQKPDEGTDPRLLSRRASVAAVEIFDAKLAWKNALREAGVGRITDEPWVRQIVTNLKLTKLKDTRHFEISTLMSDQREVQKAEGDTLVLLPDYSRRGGYGKKRLDSTLEEIMGKAIESSRHGTDPIVVTRIFEVINREVHTHNITYADSPIRMPGLSTIARRVKEKIPAIEIDRKVLSPRYLRNSYRSNSASRVHTQIPLLVSEYDDTDTNVFLISGKTGLPCGRAHLTSGICSGTLMLLGADIGIESRSFESAIGAIHHSLLPKSMAHPDFKYATSNWDGYGVQGSILLDNAVYNKCKSIRHQSDAMLLKLCPVEPYMPVAKSAIEHFNFEVQESFSPTLPGWRGIDDDPDAVKRGMAGAILFEEEFRALFVKWVTGEYMNKPGQDGHSPRQRWNSYFTGRSPAIRWTPEELSIFRLRPEMLTFRPSGGVLRLGLTYDNQWLQDIREHFGVNSKVLIYVDRKNLANVVCEHPLTRQRQTVPCVTGDTYSDGLAESAQQLVLKMCRQRKITNPSLLEMQREREELKVLTAQLSRSKKLVDRKFAERHKSVDQKASPSGVSVETNVVTIKKVVTELEAQIIELQSIELEEDYAM